MAVQRCMCTSRRLLGCNAEMGWGGALQLGEHAVLLVHALQLVRHAARDARDDGRRDGKARGVAELAGASVEAVRFGPAGAVKVGLVGGNVEARLVEAVAERD